MSVLRLTDLPDGRIVYYTYDDLDAGRIPDGAVWFEQTWEGRRYRAGGVLVVRLDELDN